MEIHTTIGLYANVSYRINGVKPEHLEDHIKYNKKYRFGRTLFVDGEVVHKRYSTVEEIESFKEKIRSNPDFIKTFCTAPYH